MVLSKVLVVHQTTFFNELKHIAYRQIATHCFPAENPDFSHLGLYWQSPPHYQTINQELQFY